MAQEYVAMSNKEKGLIAINTKVLETIAEICVGEEKGVNLSDSNVFKTPVVCKMVDDKLVLQVSIKVDYNTKVNEVSRLLQTKIYENISHMTDCKVNTITINVDGFKF